jgi:hypothetical protein
MRAMQSMENIVAEKDAPTPAISDPLRGKPLIVNRVKCISAVLADQLPNYARDQF